MPMTEEQRKSFEAACQPLIEWRRTNLCPHDKILIDSDFAEVLSGEIGFPFDPCPQETNKEAAQ